MVLEKTLESPLDCKEIKPSRRSILKEISPEYSLEGLMLKLKLQYFGYLMGRTDSFEKTLMLGKIESRRRRGRQRMRWLDGITNSKVMRKEAQHMQRRDPASGVPLEILEHLPPKPESAYFLLCAFTYTSDFTGGCLPLPLSGKRVSLQLQLIILGCDSVSTYKLLWKSSSLPEWVFPATCDCSEPPNCERQEMF